MYAINIHTTQAIHLQSANKTHIYRKLLDQHKSKQSNITNMNIFFPWKMKKELLRWDPNPRHTAYEADTLPNELPMQLQLLAKQVFIVRSIHPCLYIYMHISYDGLLVTQEVPNVKWRECATRKRNQLSEVQQSG